MAFQGLFRRHNNFVVVKPIRLCAEETLEVGTVIDMKKGNVKWFQLRLWFRRRRIGTEGSDWVNQILDGARRPEGAVISKKFDVQKLADTLVAVANDKAEEGAKELSDVKVEKPADDATEGEKEQETASTEPEVDAKEAAARAKKDAKNARERAKRAEKAAAKKAGK